MKRSGEGLVTPDLEEEDQEDVDEGQAQSKGKSTPDLETKSDDRPLVEAPQVGGGADPKVEAEPA